MLPGGGSLGDCHTALDIISASAHLAALTLNTNNDNTTQKPHLLTISIQPHCESYDNFCSHLGIIRLISISHVDYALILQVLFINPVSPFLMQSWQVTSDMISILHVPHHLSISPQSPLLCHFLHISSN